MYPHEGDWRESHTIRRAYEFNSPLIPVLTDVHEGGLPHAHSFIQLDPANLVLTSVKRAEDDDDSWIVQWYDAIGKKSEAVLTLPIQPKQAFMSNFLEEEGRSVTFKKNVIRVKTPKNGVVTVKVVFR